MDCAKYNGEDNYFLLILCISQFILPQCVPLIETLKLTFLVTDAACVLLTCPVSFGCLALKLFVASVSCCSCSCTFDCLDADK